MSLIGKLVLVGGEMTGMRVLMFGWEFPPLKTGGLGTACYGLTKGLKRIGVEISFVVPRSGGAEAPKHIKVIGARDIQITLAELEDYTHVQLIRVDVPLSPYARPEQHFEASQVRYQRVHRSLVPNGPTGSTTDNEELYGENLFEEIEEYNRKARIIAEREKFDIIHAHDWMTFRAGMEARNVSGKPLVIHVHSTEYDRTGGWGINPAVRDIEQVGICGADHIIAVSNRTKRAIMKNYGIPSEKISVVYNAIDVDDSPSDELAECYLGQRIVLFLGRITMQKGPDYFLEAAARVLEQEPDVMFVMAGDGDMINRMIERAADLNIGHKVLFTGFLRGPEVDRIYDMADVYVMSSVSEPFGITPLEAMSHGVPVIISRQSGVSEVIKHALKVDFWDIDKLADRIIALLRYKPLRDLLAKDGKSETKRFSWDDSAIQCINVYSKVLGGMLLSPFASRTPTFPSKRL
jgi:glycosyltransferase involved in cell wall biosynthesis